MNTVIINPYDVKWRDKRGQRVSWYEVATNLGFKVHAPKSLRDWVKWASGKSTYMISKVENWFWNATAFTPPTTFGFSLCTAAPTSASTGASQTEATYTSYARASVTANTTDFPTSTSGAAINNGAAISWPANTGSAQTMLGLCVNDSTTTGAGNVNYFGSISSTVINAGDTPQINVSGLTASEA